MRPVRQRDVRDANLATVLAVVASSQAPLSRAQVAAATGLTRATVSALVETLLRGGLVAEGAPAPREGAGRPAAGLRLSGERAAALGVEIGVDYLAACVRDLTGRVRQRCVEPGDRRGADPADVVADSARLAVEVLHAAAADDLEVVGAAWAVPGLVDARGLVRLAPNLGWRDVDVRALLRRDADLAALAPTVENEATLAVVAEVWRPGVGLAAAPGLLMVTGEIGIGAAVVLDGGVVRGQHGWSGELGHVTVEPSGPPCTCGSAGCLEVYAGLGAVLRAAGLPAAGATSLGEGGSPTGALVEAARAGHPAALAALERAARALGLALGGAVNLLDVDEVVLGGAYASLADWLVAPVEAEVARRALRARLEPVRVRRSVNGPDAAVLGAAAGVLQRVLEHPGRVVPA